MDIEPRQRSVLRELDRLDRDERELSSHRRTLHHDIDQLYLAAPLTPAQTAVLDELEEAERTVSRERRKLHAKIDELRAQIGLPPWRDAHELDTAA